MSIFKNIKNKFFNRSELPVPKWKPDILVDEERIAKCFAYYTDYQNNFVVFKNGTCLILDDFESDVEKQAKRALRERFNPLLSFSTEVLVDDNWYVKFQGGVIGIVFKDEIDANIEYIETNYLDGLLPTEVLFENEIGEKPTELGLNGKVGLLSRARAVMDYLEPEISYVIGKPE